MSPIELKSLRSSSPLTSVELPAGRRDGSFGESAPAKIYVQTFETGTQNRRRIRLSYSTLTKRRKADDEHDGVVAVSHPFQI